MNAPDPVPPTPVDRCVCMDVTFEEILRLYRQGLSFEHIQQRTMCGTRCGMCIPYIHVALTTGRTRLAVMDSRNGTV